MNGFVSSPRADTCQREKSARGPVPPHWSSRHQEISRWRVGGRLLDRASLFVADTVARATREATGASEEDIDLVFGWQEALYSAKMQRHYETKFNRERRTAVTRML